MTCVALLTTSSKSSIIKEGVDPGELRNAHVPLKLSFETEDGHEFDESEGDFSNFSFDILLEILTNEANLQIFTLHPNIVQNQVVCIFVSLGKLLDNIENLLHWTILTQTAMEDG